MNFLKTKYQIINSAVGTDICKLVAKEFRIVRDIALATNKINPDYRHPDSVQEDYPFADEMVPSSFSWYSPVCFEALSDVIVKPIVEKIIDQEILPTYTYGRIYCKNSVMKSHTDRTSSEFSVSLCLETDTTSEDWPLYLEDLNGNIIEVKQKPGDLIIYDGRLLKHWRNKFQGYEHINAFMFYVLKNSNRSELKYDTRPGLGFGPHTRSLNSEDQLKKFNQ